jgi:single stranded DNA-binding protein
MSDLNTITISGRLIADPIVRGGGKVAVLPIASNRQYQQNGEWQNETVFVDATAFGFAATKCIDKLTKGDQVTVSGRLELNVYQDASNETKRVHRIVVNQVESPAFIPTRYTRSFDAAPVAEGTLDEAVAATAAPEGEPVGVGAFEDDDIPF